MGAGSSTQKGGYVYSAVRHHRSTSLARGKGISLNKKTHKRKNHNKNRKSRKSRKSKKSKKNRKSRK